MIRRMKKSVFVLLIFFLFQGCVARMPGSPIIPQDARIIQQVPFYEDTGYQCGPSSLAAVMNYWAGKNNTLNKTLPENISSEIYSKDARGVLGMDMEFYARKNGFLTKQYSGSIDDLKENVLKDIPLIILVDYGVSFYQRNHFMVVTGFSGDGIILHSGMQVKYMPFDDLEKIWRKTDHWTLIIQPSD